VDQTARELGRVKSLAWLTFLAVSFDANESLAVIVSSAATDATLSSQHWL